MASGATTTRQRGEMGEGLAVGCLVVGVTALAPTAPLDPALEHALDGWPWAARYPVVRRTPQLVDTFARSPGRRGLRIAQWVRSRGLVVPQLRDDEWDLTAACARLEEGTGVPARRWIDLTRAFLDGLAPDAVWRAPEPHAMPDELPG
ncbi:hypothetical protein [Actinomycetospora atypica]|uniref:Uncharacterized protein n=1 Tax=Actinomycetospora atypica TaxID=1290095 RepID=A0ABV9YL18_9PSEU